MVCIEMAMGKFDKEPIHTETLIEMDVLEPDIRSIPKSYWLNALFASCNPNEFNSVKTTDEFRAKVQQMLVNEFADASGTVLRIRNTTIQRIQPSEAAKKTLKMPGVGMDADIKTVIWNWIVALTTDLQMNLYARKVAVAAMQCRMHSVDDVALIPVLQCRWAFYLVRLMDRFKFLYTKWDDKVVTMELLQNLYGMTLVFTGVKEETMPESAKSALVDGWTKHIVWLRGGSKAVAKKDLKEELWKLYHCSVDDGFWFPLYSE